MPIVNPPGMQRVIIQGIPVWRNADKALYAYDTMPLLQIGKNDTFNAGWKDDFSDRLATFRDGLAPRARATASVAKN